MDPIRLIVAAPAAGADSGAIDALKDDPTYGVPLAKKLAEAGAGDDADLVAAAKALMELADQKGAKPGTYSVTIAGPRSVQVRDGDLQINAF